MRARHSWRNLPAMLCIALIALMPAACRPKGARVADDYVGPARKAAGTGEAPPAAPARQEGRGEGRGARGQGRASSIQHPASSIQHPSSPLKLSVRDAILLAVANNRALQIERLNPRIWQTHESQERAVFDPVLGAELSRSKARSERLARAGGATEASISKRTSGAVTLQEFLPTGTTLDLGATSELTDSSLYDDRFLTTRLGLTVTQALLQGRSVAANLASLRQARLDTRISEYELRGFAEALVADVEQTCWDYALARRQIDIYTQSLQLAGQQLSDTQERIRIGKLAETELAAAQAEIALRREDLINARSTLAKTRLKLLRLLSPPGAALWNRTLELADEPQAPDATLDDVERHAEVAMRMRPDLNEARLRLRRGDLEIVKTRNGLLPKLDLFVTLGKSGYANSFEPSVRDIDGNGYDVAGGITFEFPLGNRGARASHERATLTRRQAAEAVDNLAQLVQVDVRSAHIEVNRAREQVAATAATRKLQEESLRAETEKFRVGKSTSFLVAQAQRDLVASQISEVEAVVTLLKGVIDLHRLEGSLLERRGIAAPGRQPVQPSTSTR